MVYQQLFDRVKEPEVVRSALIGCGDFGSAIVTQARLVPRLELRVVADTNVEAATRTFRLAGAEEEEIAVCDSPERALRAMETGKCVVVQDAMHLMDLPLHVIVTATRVPEASTRYAYQAIRHGKHVVFVDKEADSVVGPILKRLADRAGVVFTTDDGDQPGLVMGLVSWARALGLEALCGGNLHELRCSMEQGTLSTPGGSSRTVPPESQWSLARIPGGQAARYVKARRGMIAEWEAIQEDGDSLAHVVVTANGTGLTLDTSGPHLPLLHLPELPAVLCPVEDGGILQTRGVVETVTVLRPDEAVPSVDGGVFVVVSNPDQRSRQVMIAKGLMANRTGSAMLIYRPHHLCGAETAISILCAGLLRVPSGASTVLPRADIAVTADRDFGAGEVASGLGRSSTDPNLRATLIPAAPVADDTPLPFFLLEGNPLATDWPKGTVLTRRMVVAPTDSNLWSLRQQQDEEFLARR